MEIDDIKKLTNNKKLTLLLYTHVKHADYSSTNKYKRGIRSTTQKDGILMCLFGDWMWSWHNAIDTNYSCIKIIFDYIEKTFGRKFKIDDFNENNIDQTIKFIDDCLIICSKYLFASDSDEFIAMQFASQRSWNIGKISEFASIYTLKSNSIIAGYTNSYERGNEEDIKNGRDYHIKLISNEEGFVQEKFSKDLFYYMDGESYGFKGLGYIKEKYSSEYVKFLVISNGILIFIFKFEKNLLQNDNGILIINKNLMITEKPMKNMLRNVSDMLFELNTYLSENHIQFIFEMGENITSSKIEDLMDNGDRVVKIELSDKDVDEFSITLSKFLNEIKTVPS